MSTQSLVQTPHSRPLPHVTPFDSADAQAEILRSAAVSKPNGKPLEIEPGFVLQPWECQLLYREARARRHVTGVVRTLLRARAAELAVRRRLGSEQPLDADQSRSIASLLDHAIVDIGSSTDLPDCRIVEGLEDIARRLVEMYEQLSETAISLPGLYPSAVPRPRLRLESHFELEETSSESVEPQHWRALEDDGDRPQRELEDEAPESGFEIVPHDLDPPAREEQPEPAEPAATPGRLAEPACDLDAFDLVSTQTLEPSSQPSPRPPAQPRSVSQPAPQPLASQPAPQPATQPPAQQSPPGAGKKWLLVAAGAAAAVLVAAVALL